MEKNINDSNIELSKANHRAAVRNCITDICKILIVTIVVMVFAVIFCMSFMMVKNTDVRNPLIITFGAILGLIEMVATIVYLRDIIIFNKAVDYKDKILSEHAVVNKEFQNEYLTRKIDVNNLPDDENIGKGKHKR
ncbi:hypothetical protein FACS1894152_1190 [Bacilli bacterium]|nr:hypothetical protein FACS1894152_1190 [Bacilli bacterium]